jgi:hypothetical protein
MRPPALQWLPLQVCANAALLQVLHTLETNTSASTAAAAAGVDHSTSTWLSRLASIPCLLLDQSSTDALLHIHTALQTAATNAALAGQWGWFA